MRKCHLDEAHPLLERQIRRPRVRGETLRRSADNNGDRAPGTFRQDTSAGWLGDRAHAMEEEQITVEGDLEVGFEGKEVGLDAGEVGREASALCSECCKCAPGSSAT